MQQTIGATTQRTRFFVWMAGLALLIALTGFLPTYWLPMLRGSSFPPILHIHGSIFIAWNALFFWQALLVANGRTPDHRNWGMLGIAIATAMVISVLLAVLSSYVRAAAIGMELQARAFSAVSLLGILYFAVVFTLAIRAVRIPDVHRRLMYGASVPLLQAAVARWFQAALAPPGAVGPPLVVFSIPPGILVWLAFFVPLFLHDRRTLGHIHPASLRVSAAALAVILLPLLLGPSAAWAGFTEAFAGLAQH
jgi:hypothetical protein